MPGDDMGGSTAVSLGGQQIVIPNEDSGKLDEIVRGHCINSASSATMMMDQLQRLSDNEPIPLSRQPTPLAKGAALSMIEPPWVTSARSSHATTNESQRERGESLASAAGDAPPTSAQAASSADVKLAEHTLDDPRGLSTLQASHPSLAPSVSEEIESEIDATRGGLRRNSRTDLGTVPEAKQATGDEPPAPESGGRQSQARRLSLGSLAKAATSPNLANLVPGGLTPFRASTSPDGGGGRRVTMPPGKTDFEAHQQTAAARRIVELSRKPMSLMERGGAALRRSSLGFFVPKPPAQQPSPGTVAAPPLSPAAAHDIEHAMLSQRNSAKETSGSLKGVLPVSRAGGPPSSKFALATSQWSPDGLPMTSSWPPGELPTTSGRPPDGLLMAS